MDNTDDGATKGAFAEHLNVRFTGSGSEYFRIWIVNLALTLLTLGIYYPFAKVRRLRYLYANTLVGEHALGFHGNPWKMLRGYALVAAMLGLYSVAGRVSPTAGLLVALIIAAIWPALLKSSLQFRLANTSWRGLRLRFNGTLGGAYRAMLPLFIPILLIFGALLSAEGKQHPPPVLTALLALAPLASLLIVPWIWWLLKRYQHGNYAYGPVQTELRASCGSFYRLFAKTSGVALLAFAAAAILVAAAVPFLKSQMPAANSSRSLFALLPIGFIVLGLAVQWIARTYLLSRMQNLLWSNTGHALLQFDSRLAFLPLLGLNFKNALLIVLTLGFYWPFALIATARMRLEAVSLQWRVDVQTLEARARGAEGDAAGDAAGDLIGFDIGL